MISRREIIRDCRQLNIWVLLVYRCIAQPNLSSGKLTGHSVMKCRARNVNDFAFLVDLGKVLGFYTIAVWRHWSWSHFRRERKRKEIQARKSFNAETKIQYLMCYYCRTQKLLCYIVIKIITQRRAKRRTHVMFSDTKYNIIVN